MKKSVTLLCIFGLCLAVPALAQEGGPPEGEMMEAMEGPPPMPPVPPPLDSEWANFLVGDWKGKSMGPRGEVDQFRSCELGLDGQFLFCKGRAEGPEGNIWKGRGALSQDEEGNWVGIWFSNRREVFRANGRTEDGRLLTRWESNQGVVLKFAFERIDDDTWGYHETVSLPDGHEMKIKGRLHRQ